MTTVNRRGLFGGVVVVLVSVALAVALSEGVARREVSRRPVPEFSKSLLNSVRLWEPNLDLQYDVRGMYPAADKVRLRTSEVGLIEPTPSKGAEHRLKVLFLGGSTTESLYLPEEERWVALLNQQAGVAAYNAGQSGANILDKHFGFSYLTEKKMRFDLVVLMTAVNDFAWQLRFDKIKAKFRQENYFESLGAFQKSEFERELGFLDRCSFRLALCEMARRFVGRVKDQANEARFLSAAKGQPLGNVAANYLTHRVVSPRPVELDALGPLVDRVVDEFRDNEFRNLVNLKKAIESTGAKLLVMSEPLSYGGDSEGFYLDLRSHLMVSEQLLSHKAASELFDRINAQYLEAAREAGAEVFDLAARMKVPAPEVGKYFYDHMHYTPAGSHKVASLLVPVLAKP